MVNAQKKVVSMTVLLVRVPRCPILLAMTYQLTVVGDPHMISTAASFS